MKREAPQGTTSTTGAPPGGDTKLTTLPGQQLPGQPTPEPVKPPNTVKRTAQVPFALWQTITARLASYAMNSGSPVCIAEYNNTFRPQFLDVVIKDEIQ